MTWYNDWVKNILKHLEIKEKMFKSSIIAASIALAARASVEKTATSGSTKSSGYGKGSSSHKAASDENSAAVSGHDNDEYAKQSYGQDTDFAWGKSYDSVKANSYDDEQYERAIHLDDDWWAEDYDSYEGEDEEGYDEAASSKVSADGKVTVTVTPKKAKGDKEEAYEEEEDDGSHYLDGFDIPHIPQEVHQTHYG